MRKNLTEKMLTAIAKRLSSRQDCRGVEYDVYITTSTKTQNLQYIKLTPCILVFPDNYHRRDIDKYSVIQHVLTTMIYDNKQAMIDNTITTFTQDFNITETQCKQLDLDDGHYRYIKSVDGKKRKWIKVC